jgi:hypothetical protein
MNFTLGPRNWVVEEVSQSWFRKNVDDSKVHGWCCEETATIYLVKPFKSEEFKELTLRHEILHAMLYSLGIREHDEVLVDGLAHAWLQYDRSVVVDDQ